MQQIEKQGYEHYPCKENDGYGWMAQSAFGFIIYSALVISGSATGVNYFFEAVILTKNTRD